MNNLFNIKPKEADITREIRAYLKLRGIWHWKHHSGLGSMPGVADILGCFKGKFLAIEVKTPGGKVTERQQAFLDRVNYEGGLAFVARSVEEVIGPLKGV
jgi:hypothetical protein